MSKEAFNEAMAYVRALDEQDQSAITAADALAAAANEWHERDCNCLCECGYCHPPTGPCKLGAALAEYRKIRPQEAKNG